MTMPAPAPEDRLPPDALLNMELSTLSFNERVLALAEDPRVPLLERVRFVSIFGANLDEFFMTRAAGYKRQVATGSTKSSLDGLSPEEQLRAIAEQAHPLVDRAYQFLTGTLLPELEAHGIRVIPWAELGPEEQAYLRDFYLTQLSAVLTPLAGPGQRFPHMRNLRPALGAVVRTPGSTEEYFTATTLPGDLPRFVPLPGGRRFVPLEELVQATLAELHPELEIVRVHPFRVARSANFSIDEEHADDLLQAVESEVAKRPFQAVVRLEVERSMPEEMREMLLQALQSDGRQNGIPLQPDDVYSVDWLVDLDGLREIASLPIRELHYPPLRRSVPIGRERPIFEALREGDVMVRFPFDSFEQTVERFVAEAADDPDVLAIKITLYRTSRSSRIVRLLRRARRRGKQVAAVVELKASFDERRNIEWARSLEAAGIDVVYGPPRLKVHAKIALVTRREGDTIRSYLYIGTGNLNAATAAAYTDLGLFSTSDDLGDELNQLFGAMTAETDGGSYEHLLVAPFNMRSRFLELIEREAEHARAGRGGHIRAKLNGLAAPDVIAALYRASAAGVQIDLIVRGICCLRPGVPGLSENIRVVSLLGRFLEHARIFCFGNAGEPEYFIGSADWRPRNLIRRIEVVTPVRGADHCATLDEILESNLSDPNAWELHADGSYSTRAPTAAAADSFSGNAAQSWVTEVRP